jgi:hypothetical protein
MTATNVSDELKPCPFCGEPLTVGGGCNPYGRCDTENCWMSARRIALPIDDPRQVEAWNTRASPPLPSTGVEDLTRPIIGIENRTPQEVFDIMADRFMLRSAALSALPLDGGDVNHD